MRDYPDTRPTSAVLFVAVSKESLYHNRTVTVYRYARYARYGSPEYWLLALPRRPSRGHRDLPADAYRSVTKHATGNVVAPLARPTRRSS